MSIEPAMTAEEWARLETRSHVYEAELCYWKDPNEAEAICLSDGSTMEALYVPLGIFHGLAALCLHNQLFGFTREGLNAIRVCIGSAEDSMRQENDVIARAFAEASKLEALLPPEEK